MNDANPYASPQTPGPFSADPPVTTAWRAGELLLAQRSGAVLPKACIKTNRQGRVLRYSITTLTTRAAVLVMALFLMPFLGLLLGCLVVLALVPTGEAANTAIWLRPRIALRFWAYDLTTVLLVLAGNVTSGAAILQAHPLMFSTGMACTLVGIAVSMLPFQRLEILRLELRPPDLVCIHGAHPDYLDRLPLLELSATVDSTGDRGVVISG